MPKLKGTGDCDVNFFVCLFFKNWDSVHARLNSHYEARNYKKKKYKKIKAYRKYKDPTDKKCLVILHLKQFRS